MDATTAQLLDYYKEHLSELVSTDTISVTDAATNEHFAECIASGTDPFASVATEAERVIKDAATGQ
jgi:hypothetical protein